MTHESKICVGCNQPFERNTSDTDYLWKIRRYCTFRCRTSKMNKERRTRHYKREAYDWEKCTGEPPPHILRGIEQRHAAIWLEKFLAEE